MTRQAGDGDTVQLHYVGTLTDGTQFDTSKDREPMTVTLGQGQVIPGFETAVNGMSIGETRSFTIASEEAYGPSRPELVQQIDRTLFPEEAQVSVGQMFELETKSGDVVPVTITEIEDSAVTVDANHPLAGEDLTFTVELVAIS